MAPWWLEAAGSHDDDRPRSHPQVLLAFATSSPLTLLVGNMVGRSHRRPTSRAGRRRNVVRVRLRAARGIPIANVVRQARAAVARPLSHFGGSAHSIIASQAFSQQRLTVRNGRWKRLWLSPNCRLAGRGFWHASYDMTSMLALTRTAEFGYYPFIGMVGNESSLRMWKEPS